MEILDGYGLSQGRKTLLQGLVHILVLEIQFFTEISLILCMETRRKHQTLASSM